MIMWRPRRPGDFNFKYLIDREKKFDDDYDDDDDGCNEMIWFDSQSLLNVIVSLRYLIHNSSAASTASTQSSSS
jgi:hypothetical protein